MNSFNIPSPTNDGAAVEALSVDEIVDRVHNGFANNRKWGEVPVGLVQEVVGRLNLASEERAHPTPRLRVQRLRFVGEKALKDGGRAPINYDQPFREGVNVLLVQDNSVGKSSVFKTIKFALTGDDSDFDGDVRSWIQQVWLHLTIGGAQHTIHLWRSESGLAGYIAAGHVDTSYPDVESSDTVIITRLSGPDARPRRPSPVLS